MVGSLTFTMYEHSFINLTLLFSEINIEGYKTDNCDILTIEASVVTGFECAAKEEVKTKLDITDADVKEFTGRVLFDIKSDKLEKVLNLRTVDNVWIIIGAKTDFDLTQSEEEGLATLVDYTLNNLQWTKGLSSWNKIFVSACFLLHARINNCHLFQIQCEK